MFLYKKVKLGKMTNWVEGKMSNPSTLNQELVVLSECHLPFPQLTPGENEHFIKNKIEEKEDRRKLNKAEINKTKRNKPPKNSTKKKKVAK
ncbi:hypothetical protein AVEN_271030-1 [Araneus ventricosus]|uniref:Uncharacterized protein n=1 Tax=Araneus ventricosus TaxID=182803 RepID=A0A4Y2JXA8_ARAVE|nr:hypothetical protein AVEN_271030-1 [Araneus ventricosus]